MLSMFKRKPTLTSRIDTKILGFSRKYNTSNKSKQNSIVFFAVKTAVEQSRLSDEIIFQALKYVENPNLGRFAYIKDIETLRDKYDQIYFELFLDDEKEHSAEDKELGLINFRKSRAASALVFALHANTNNDFLDCIYESLFAVEENDEFLKQIINLV